MHIIPIASGKGGVGKSLFTANLGIALAQNGKRVIVADLDLGGSNLHLILGIRKPSKKGIGFFIGDSRSSLTDFLQPTDYSNLTFLAGDSEIPGMANLTSAQKRRLTNQLQGLDADYLLLDLGAGSSFNTIDFFLLSGGGVIVTTPTPTALVNAYVFLKSSMFRMLHGACKKGSEGQKLLTKLEKDTQGIQRIYLQDLLRELWNIDPKSAETYESMIRRFQPRLVMNMLDDPKEADKVQKLRRSCQQYLSLELEHLGVMFRDEMQDLALGSGLPIIVYKPKSVLSMALYRIADKIIQYESEDRDSMVLSEMDFSDDSFETAELEAQLDYQSKIEYLEELLHTGSLTLGDVMETLKMQQYEVQQLKRENTLLKKKLLNAIEQGFTG
jgi:flagellar biosynthesis protein FlhG